MPFAVSYRIEGFEAVQKAFDGLKASLRKKHLRKAMVAAGKDVLWAARKRTPKRTKLLYKSLGRKVKVYPSGVVVAIVGARKGFKQSIGTRQRDSRPGTKYPKKAGEPIMADPTKYLHLVELGTSRSRPVRMLADAMRSSRPSFVQHVANAVNAAIQEAHEGK